MGIFGRKAEPAPRIQTLGEMVAYSLVSEATRAGWKRSGKELSNKVLGVLIPEYVWRDGITVRGKPVPLGSDDVGRIERAVRDWRAWDNECRRAEAMVSFVDAFERAASGIEARRAATTKIGAVHESPTAKPGRPTSITTIGDHR